jgi:hypothetical protein
VPLAKTRWERGIMSYSNKNVLVIDNGGLGIVHAERIARDVNHCWYWTFFKDAFPKIENYAIGYGIGNIEKIMHPFEYIDKADLIYFTDIGWGDLVDYLRKQGKIVFGSGLKTQELEDDKFLAKKVQSSLGLPIPYTKRIKGLSNLTAYLNANTDVYVKPYVFRGTRETTRVNSKYIRESLINRLHSRLGPMKDDVVFVCEDAIKHSIIETGFDIVLNGRKAIKPYLFGIESKGTYLAHYVNKLPEPISTTLDKVSTYLCDNNYRGAFSDEELVVSKDKSFMLDWTCRWAHPLSAIFTEVWRNYTEVIFKCASGEDATIDIAGEYVGCLPITSEEAIEEWLPLDINGNNATNVKVCYACRTKNGIYSVPGFPVVMKVIAWGKTIDSVKSKLVDIAKEINAHDIDINTSSILNIDESIHAMERHGIIF